MFFSLKPAGVTFYTHLTQFTEAAREPGLKFYWNNKPDEASNKQIKKYLVAHHDWGYATMRQVENRNKQEVEVYVQKHPGPHATTTRLQCG